MEVLYKLLKLLLQRPDLRVPVDLLVLQGCNVVAANDRSELVSPLFKERTYSDLSFAASMSQVHG